MSDHKRTCETSEGGVAQQPARDEWRVHAACAGLDPNLFFTERGESTRDAKAVCARCPVAEPCLDYALTNGERYGVWGGRSERERRRMRRDRRVAVTTVADRARLTVVDGAA
jgi:WhiB family redox-sensing transcriptional regulator